MNILIGILQIVLVLISLFLILVVLMQPGSANGGMGAAMGGGAAESALGAESSSVLSKVTTKTAIVFFVFVLGLNLLILGVHDKSKSEAEDALPEFELPTEEETAEAVEATNTFLTDLVDDAIKEKRAAEGEVPETEGQGESLVEQATEAAQEIEAEAEEAGGSLLEKAEEIKAGVEEELSSEATEAEEALEEALPTAQ
ncbi:preprotein translocase subunit SecG [Puniceicoccaceae bacterium K14]|nr:preprotein translocase subunit SecG [Puniceicoccaceae bacterium K14]